MFLIMNNLIFKQDVFPIPQLSLTSPPPGDLEASLTSWRRGIFTEHSLRLPVAQNEIRGNKVPELDTSLDTGQVNIDAEQEIINNSFQTEPNQSEVDSEQDSTTDYAGGIIPENEKYL
jgi:hypothetical protein